MLNTVSRAFVGVIVFLCFFFQAEDGIRAAQESRGLGDVYKRQVSFTIEKMAAMASIAPAAPRR